MEKRELAAHESLDLHEIINFKTLCVAKSKLMQGLVFDQDLKTLMEKDVQQASQNLADLQAVYERATFQHVFDDDVFHSLIRYGLHAVIPPVLVFIRCAVKHPFSVRFNRKQIHVSDHEGIFRRELVQFILFAQIMRVKPLFADHQVCNFLMHRDSLHELFAQQSSYIWRGGFCQSDGGISDAFFCAYEKIHCECHICEFRDVQ